MVTKIMDVYKSVGLAASAYVIRPVSLPRLSNIRLMCPDVAGIHQGQSFVKYRNSSSLSPDPRLKKLVYIYLLKIHHDL